MAKQSSLYDNELLSDVTLRVGRGDFESRQDLKAHKCILANKSEWFLKRFTSGSSGTDADKILDLSAELVAYPKPALVAAISHAYDEPYHNFAKPTQEPSAADALDYDSDESESSTGGQVNEGSVKALLKHKFFVTSPNVYKPYSEDNRSKLRHHGEVYSLAHRLEMPSLSAKITACANEIFAESVDKKGFAEDLIELFDCGFADQSFPEALLAICTSNIEKLFKDRDFSEGMLKVSPFNTRLLLKCLMGELVVGNTVRVCGDCKENKAFGSTSPSVCALCSDDLSH